MADSHAMFCFVLFCFFAALQFHEQKKYDLYVLSGSKFSAADLDKSYGYFNLFSGYFSYLDLFFRRQLCHLWRDSSAVACNASDEGSYVPFCMIACKQ